VRGLLPVIPLRMTAQPPLTLQRRRPGIPALALTSQSLVLRREATLGDRSEEGEDVESSSSTSSTAEMIWQPKRIHDGIPALRLPAEIANLTEAPKARSAPPSLGVPPSATTPLTGCPHCMCLTRIVPFRDRYTWICYNELDTRPPQRYCGTIWSTLVVPAASIARFCPKAKCRRPLEYEVHFGQDGYACRHCKRFYPREAPKHVQVASEKKTKTPLEAETILNK